MRNIIRVAIFAALATVGYAQSPVVPTSSDPDPITMTASGCVVNYLGGTITSGTWTMEFVDNNNQPTVFRTGSNQIMVATTMTGSITSGSMINPRTNTSTFLIPNPANTSLTNYGLHVTLLDKSANKVTTLNKIPIMLNDVPVSGRYTQFNACKINASMNNAAAPLQIIQGPKGDTGATGATGSPGVATYTGNTNTPGATDVTLMTGSDFGAKLNTCMSAITTSAPTTGGICEARNYNGTAQTMTTSVTVTQDNITIYLPCATVTTSTTFKVAAGVSNTTIHGCSNRGGSSSSGALGGSVWVYTGSGDAFDIGDSTYGVNTSGFHMDNVSILTTTNTSASSAMRFYRTQEIDLHNLYFNGPQSVTAGNIGLFLDGTGNYSGGTFDSIQLAGYAEMLHLDGHLSGSVSGDFANASTFTRLHINCPESSGSPITGSIGINIAAGDGNTFTGGDVEGCDTMMHFGANAVNNTVVGLRNEVSNTQFLADKGSSYNSVVTGGTFFAGALVDNGSRNNFQDAFHYDINGVRGNWYASQIDATVTNHVRLGTGLGHERGIADEYQTDYGYRWFIGLSDGAAQNTDGSGGGQEWYVMDEIANVARFAAGQNLTATTGTVLVTNVVVNNGGCYSTAAAQTVTFTGGGATTPATGQTSMITSTCSGGWQIGSITMLTGGAGYTSQPTATVDPTYQLSTPHLVAEISTPGSANNQTLINSTGIGGVVINGTNGSGTGGLVLGTGGSNAQSNNAVFSVTNAGNVSMQGTLNLVDSRGNDYWQIYMDSSNNFNIRNANYPSNPYLIKAVQNNNVNVNSQSTFNVSINASVNAGTGGFGVYSGGTSPVQWFNVGSGGYTKVTALAGSGDRCVYADSSGGLNVTSSACGSGNGNGSVTSVGLSLPSDFVVNGSPITGSGVLTATWNTEQPNAFLAGPATGSTAASPTWRAITVADVPTLNQNTTGTAANVTATSNSTITTLSSLALPYSQLTFAGLAPSSGYACVHLSYAGALGVTGADCGAGSGMVYPGAGVAVSTGTGWGTSLTAANLATLSGTQTFTANTTTFQNSAAATDYIVIAPGNSGNPEIGALEFATYSGTTEWEVRDDASYNFHIRNSGATTPFDILIGYANQSTYVNSQGVYGVGINASTNAGTGGFTVYSGGSSPTNWFSVTGSTSIKMPGLAASSGYYGLRVDSSGWVTNTGAAPATVSSVGLTMPSDFTVGSSPVTGSGTIAVTRVSETANYFLAAPNGSAGTPTYRAIVAADLPSLSTIHWTTGSSYLPTAATDYIGSASLETGSQKDAWIAPRAGTVQSCSAALSAAQSTSNYYTLTVYKNGSLCSGLSLVMNSTSAFTATNDTTHSCSVAQGDQLTWQAAYTGTPTTAMATVSCVF
ncbi:MAG: hypothetical protein WAN50_00375 [Minisyncoccia bacterium]